MINLDALEAAARAAAEWQGDFEILDSGVNEGWCQAGDNWDCQLLISHADPATVLALVRIARAAVEVATNDPDGIVPLRVYTALRDAGLL